MENDSKLERIFSGVRNDSHRFAHHWARDKFALKKENQENEASRRQ